MDDDIREKYLKAGKIASQVREESTTLVRVGATLLSVAEALEARIRELGGEPAFPINLSLNELAAHYTPAKNDTTIIPEGAVIKIDVGVHVDGYVADTAHTISVGGRHNDLVVASKEAVQNAVELCTPGALLSSVSARIDETVRGLGFNPVSNLTGHGLGRYYLHDEPQVPNVKTNSSYRLKEDQVIAIEPFATSGAGRVKETEPTLIFMLLEQKPVRSQDGRSIVQFASRYHGLPFAERWLPLSTVRVRIAMRELRERGVVYDYPPLKEISGGLVSQAEHTVIVAEEPVVTTR